MVKILYSSEMPCNGLIIYYVRPRAMREKKSRPTAGHGGDSLWGGLVMCRKEEVVEKMYFYR